MFKLIGKAKFSINKNKIVMSKINSLKILIVGLTTVLALTNFGKEKLKEEKTRSFYLLTNFSSNEKDKL